MPGLPDEEPYDGEVLAGIRELAVACPVYGCPECQALSCAILDFSSL